LLVKRQLLDVRNKNSTLVQIKKVLRKVRERYEIKLKDDLSTEIVAEVAIELDNQEKLTKEYSIIIFYSADFR
jgi:uncharacterized protein YxjI